jgi:hypothetical protein
MAELAGRFYSSLKSCTSGYATLDYEEGPYRSADLVRLDFLIHGAPVDALTRVVHRSDALSVARTVCQKLKTVITRQAFEVWHLYVNLPACIDSFQELCMKARGAASRLPSRCGSSELCQFFVVRVTSGHSLCLSGI